MTSKIVYEGNLRTRMTHTYSGTEVITDAPLDNRGLAQAFSPTDLVATALGSCMMTIIGIKAREMNVDDRFTGTQLYISKVMESNPRRIGKIEVHVMFPKHHFTEKEKTIFENAARACPVAKSLHPDIEQHITFEW